MVGKGDRVCVVEGRGRSSDIARVTPAAQPPQCSHLNQAESVIWTCSNVVVVSFWKSLIFRLKTNKMYASELNPDIPRFIFLIIVCVRACV